MPLVKLLFVNVSNTFLMSSKLVAITRHMVLNLSSKLSIIVIMIYAFLHIINKNSPELYALSGNPKDHVQREGGKL